MLEDAEVRRADRVAVINEAAARLWSAGEDPIGKQLRLDLLKNPGGPVLAPTNASPYVTVVGVVGNTRNDGIRNEARPCVLLPYTLLAPPGRTLAIRTAGDATAVFNALRSRLRQIDPQTPVQNPQPLEAALLNQRLQPRFIMALFTLFAAFGLILAAMGIYSVLSYLVTRRTREIGIRVALGAQHRDIIRLIFGSGGRLVGVGIVVGVVMSLIAARLLGSQLNLFRVTATDPVTFCGVIILLGVVATAACLVPARRAGKVDPMVALRHE
jgi:putative ABC transport system permease protein